jgi:hypothetical protein
MSGVPPCPAPLTRALCCSTPHPDFSSDAAPHRRIGEVGRMDALPPTAGAEGKFS